MASDFICLLSSPALLFILLTEDMKGLCSQGKCYFQGVQDFNTSLVIEKLLETKVSLEITGMDDAQIKLPSPGKDKFVKYPRKCVGGLHSTTVMNKLKLQCLYWSWHAVINGLKILTS